MVSLTLREHSDRLLADVASAVRRHYGDRLVSLVVFGSMGRGTQRSDSDLDLLIVADGLPQGRLARVEDFAPVEAALAPRLEDGRRAGFPTECSPVFKTPNEVLAGSPLLLDMVDDARILHDPEGVLAGRLGRLRARLAELGARRVPHGGGWYWELKPDLKPGEVFTL